jgi:DNA-directed RNA polymerase subunit RPC12/RpoP
MDNEYRNLKGSNNLGSFLLLKCHTCEVEFAIQLREGGICDNCTEPTCNSHLSRHKIADKTLYICSKCVSKSTAM